MKPDRAVLSARSAQRRAVRATEPAREEKKKKRAAGTTSVPPKKPRTGNEPIPVAASDSEDDMPLLDRQRMIIPERLSATAQADAGASTSIEPAEVPASPQPAEVPAAPTDPLETPTRTVPAGVDRRAAWALGADEENLLQQFAAEAREQLRKIVPEGDDRSIDEVANSSLRHLFGLVRDSVAMDQRLSGLQYDKILLTRQVEAAVHAREASWEALTASRAELLQLRADYEAQKNKMADLLAQRTEQEAKLKQKKKKIKTLSRRLKVEEERSASLDTRAKAFQAAVDRHKGLLDTTRVMLKTANVTAVDTYKASKEFEEEMNEAGTVGFEYGYEECFEKVRNAFPEADLSFLRSADPAEAAPLEEAEPVVPGSGIPAEAVGTAAVEEAEVEVAGAGVVEALVIPEGQT